MENGIIRPMLRSLLISYLLSGVLLASLAFALFKLHMSEGSVNLMVFAIYLLACLTGGFLAGRKIGSAASSGACCPVCFIFWFSLPCHGP